MHVPHRPPASFLAVSAMYCSLQTWLRLGCIKGFHSTGVGEGDLGVGRHAGLQHCVFRVRG